MPIFRETVTIHPRGVSVIATVGKPYALPGAPGDGDGGGDPPSGDPPAGDAPEDLNAEVDVPDVPISDGASSDLHGDLTLRVRKMSKAASAGALPFKDDAAGSSSASSVRLAGIFTSD